MENQIEMKTEEKKKRGRRSRVGITGTENLEGRNQEFNKLSVKITFEGEVAGRILKCESDLKERLSKPEMGKILGAEILSWNEKRWTEIVEENTDVEFFFAQIKNSSDKSKSIRLLKALAEKLKNDTPEEPSSADQVNSDKNHEKVNEFIENGGVHGFTNPHANY